VGVVIASAAATTNVSRAVLNPLQVATLRWYGAISSLQFPVETGPEAVAFDGANIWVANSGSNSVTKLRANDGGNLGTFPVGTGPENMAFDGANIWVTHVGSNVSFRQGCVIKKAVPFLRRGSGEDTAHRGASDIEAAGDLGFGEARVP
jgi:DNA-binding beta-propeller fold protein YncE